KIGKKLERDINEFYKEKIREEYDRNSYLELEFDKCFVKFLMPKIRGGEKGAKKRYAGLIAKDGKEKIEFTGLEAKRSDWTELAQKFQYEILNRVFHNQEVIAFIKGFVAKLTKGELDSLLVYKKSMRKELEDYTKITPQHVKAARKMEKIESRSIEYVMTEDGPEPIQNLQHKIDYQHYINKQLKPIADSILCFFNKTFEEVIAGSKQTNLSNY
ncbi:DNA polymerase II, partial [Candidatus Woesearchaeota archaeon]|nr:DNA polymerase II [Candidatus Woesearchaeota archaeon]